MDDQAEFASVLNAMKVINISDENQNQIFNILAGILHIGNINFTETQKSEAALDDQRSENTHKK